MSRKEHIVDVDEFWATYKEAITNAVWRRRREAVMAGRQTFIVYDDELAEIEAERQRRDGINGRLREATNLNNLGMKLEGEFHFDEAIECYEKNILPDTHLTIHPYRRLCILYASRRDAENEIRVAKAAIERLPDGKEKDWFIKRINKYTKSK